MQIQINLFNQHWLASFEIVNNHVLEYPFSDTGTAYANINDIQRNMYTIYIMVKFTYKLCFYTAFIRTKQWNVVQNGELN